MRDSRKYAWCVTILCGLILCLILLGVKWTAAVESPPPIPLPGCDTLWVEGERANNSWYEAASCMIGPKTTCIDEHHVPRDYGYLWTSTTGSQQDWYFGVPLDTSGILDSIGFGVRVVCIDDLMEVALVFRWWEWELLEWWICVADTFLLTTGFENYFVVKDTNFCACQPREWYWSDLFEEGLAWGVVSMGGENLWQISWSYLVYYHHEED